MSVLTCAEVLPHLESQRRGDCSRELAALLDEHLARCPECRRQLAHLKQVTALLAAWRPRPAPRGLKIEIAEAVGKDLESAARQLYGLPPFLRPRHVRLPALPVYQRVVNTLAIATLAFLAGVIIYEVLRIEWRDTPASQTAMCDVVLLNAGPRKIEVAALIRQVSNMGLLEANEAVDATAVVIKRGLPRTEAESLVKQFTALAREPKSNRSRREPGA